MVYPLFAKGVPAIWSWKEMGTGRCVVLAQSRVKSWLDEWFLTINKFLKTEYIIVTLPVKLLEIKVKMGAPRETELTVNQRNLVSVPYEMQRCMSMYFEHDAFGICLGNLIITDRYILNGL